MARQTPLITVGDVIEVQLTSERVVIRSAQGREAQPAHITSRMRLFVKELDGSEHKYDFDDTELGVRETQRVGIVRARFKGQRDPQNLALFNLSSGESDAFEPALAAYLQRRPLVGPRGHALGWALVVALLTWAISNWGYRGGEGGPMSVFLAVAFAVLTFPIVWGLSALWDRLSARARYGRARAAFLSDAEAQVRALAGAAARPPGIT